MIASVSSVKVVSVWPGTNQVVGMPRRANSVSSRFDADARPELGVAQLHRRVAAADRIGDRVVVDGDRDGQAGCLGHRVLRRAVDGRSVASATGPARAAGRALPYPSRSMATTERDYYEILGVERTATDAEIKRAFRKLAQQWHPDVSNDPAAHERFKEINEAYQVLSDPERRQRYDMFGRAGVDGGGGAGFEGFGGFCDIFDAFFGGGPAAGAARRGRPQPGADLRYDLRITFEEAVKGTEQGDRVPRPPAAARPAMAPAPSRAPRPSTCPQCDGRGEVRSVRQTMLGQMVNVSACPRCRGEGKIVETPCETCHGDGRTERKRTLRVTIPAGIDEGHQIRLSGEGEVGPRGGPPGSLYVAVHVAAPVAQARRHRALLRGDRVDRPGGARDEDHGPDRRRRGGGRDQARHPARHRDPAARQGRRRISAGRARRATSTCSSTSSCRPSSRSASASC